MGIFVEMVAVDRAQPGPTASVAEIAAWHWARARLHEHLAAEGGPDAAQEDASAASAHQYAPAQLREAAA